VPPHDTGLMAAAMVGSAIEVGVAMVARNAEFVTNVFVAAFPHLR
jgi:F0F1-type ATP synthase membrane subunit c/vacuolar-type H+-ATPase subunit K